MKNHMHLLLVPAVMTLTAGCKNTVREEPETQVVQVQTLIAAEREVIFPVRSSGKLASRTESKLGFKTGGIIDRILVEEGQDVDEGQLLAQLNLEEIRSQAGQADLALDKAERDYKRTENLYRDSVATLEQYQNARTALEVARSNAGIAAFNLEYSAIRAPTRGRILKRLAEVNEIIAPGYPVFLFASTEGDWVVKTGLTDRDVLRVGMLDSAQVRFDAYPGEIFTGTVSLTGTAADPYTGTYEVEIQLVRKPERLVSGLIANVMIYPSRTERKVIIPMEALVEGAGLTGFVYILEDDRPRRRKIRISRLTDEGMVIEEGIRPGEEVVTLGARYIDSDSRIQRTGPAV